jgi:hypothetical protein
VKMRELRDRIGGIDEQLGRAGTDDVTREEESLETMMASSRIREHCWRARVWSGSARFTRRCSSGCTSSWRRRQDVRVTETCSEARTTDRRPATVHAAARPP